jgi:uncharacterized membrane protein
MISTSAKQTAWWVRIAIMVHFSIIMLLGLSRHWGYMSSINDLGVFDQAVWSLLHGELLLNTSQLNQPINWLGFHFHPILFLFFPLYAVFPNIIWFTTAQAIALAIGAWPIFLLAKYVSKSDKIGFFWALVYMINPFLLNAAAWDFHPTSLAVPFVATGMLAIEMKNFRLLIFSSLFILICQEHLGIMVVGFGFLWWMRNKQWRKSFVLILLGIAYFVLVIGVIMPAFSPMSEHLMLRKGLGHLSRYSWLGDSLREIFKTALFHPIFVIKTIMLEIGGVKYLLVLLIFFLGLPLAAPEFLLPGLADLMANMMSANPMPRNVFSYHSVCLVPMITVAAVYGTERISRWSKKFSIKELASFVLIVNFLGGYFLSPLPLPGARNVWAPTNFMNWPDPTLPAIRSAVGGCSSISAQSNIGVHFSQRREIYCYPNKVGEVDVIILRLESPTTNINNIPKRLINQRNLLFYTLDGHLQMDRKDYTASIDSLLSDPDYGILLWNNPWLVLKRGKKNQRSQQVLNVKEKLNQLREEWKINTEQ